MRRCATCSIDEGRPIPGATIAPARAAVPGIACRLLAAAVILLTPAPARAQARLTLDQLLDSNAVAMGGRARLDRLAAVVTLRTTTSLTSLKLPDFVLIEGYDSAGAVRYAEGYDGHQAWEQTREDSARRVVTGRAEVALRRVAQWPGNIVPLYRVGEFGDSLALEGVDSLEGELYYRLRLTLQDGFQRWYFVNATSYLIELARDARELHANDGNTREIETLFTDYRPVDGYWFPFTVIERDLHTGATLSARTVLDFFPGVELPDSLFAAGGHSDPGRLERFRALAASRRDGD
ncbi:MAG: hypothetical protein ACHQ2E_09820 [Gemmatimonadales bacterium]